MIAIPLEIGNYDKEKTSYLDKVENNVIEKIPIKAELEVKKNLSNQYAMLVVREYKINFSLGNCRTETSGTNQAKFCYKF